MPEASVITNEAQAYDVAETPRASVNCRYRVAPDSKRARAPVTVSMYEDLIDTRAACCRLLARLGHFNEDFLLYGLFVCCNTRHTNTHARARARTPVARLPRPSSKFLQDSNEICFLLYVDYREMSVVYGSRRAQEAELWRISARFHYRRCTLLFNGFWSFYRDL